MKDSITLISALCAYLAGAWIIGKFMGHKLDEHDVLHAVIIATGWMIVGAIREANQ